MDFKGAFKGYVEKKLNKLSSTRDMDEEERNKTIASIALDRKEMQQLLGDVGVTMKRNEVMISSIILFHMI